MFKYKIKVILKSGYEIRTRAKECSYNVDMDNNFYNLKFENKNEKDLYISNYEIVAIIVKHWYQRWE